MKILFVHLGREHLGIEYLSSALKKDGHEVHLAHDPGLFTGEDNVFHSHLLEKFFERREYLLQRVKETGPGLVAFSVYTSTYLWAKSLALEIKQKFGLPILFGGIHATLVPEEVISNDFVDYLIVGEGEQAVCELAAALEKKNGLSGIRNLWFKENGAVIKNDVREPIRDLDSLPFPDKALFEGDIRYRDDYMIMIGRGCIYHCSYCCESYLNKLYNGKFFRRRSVDSVIRELKEAKKKYQIKEVMFFDAIFFTDKRWLKDLLKRYVEEINVPFRCTGHVSFFDDEVGAMMKSAGCYCIDFGTQTFNEAKRIRLLNRAETNEQIKKALRICDSLEMRYDVDLIFGLPEATEEDYKSTLELLRDFRYLNRIKCYYLAYYPKLEIVNRALEANLLSPEDVRDIERGKVGDWFHHDSIKDRAHKRLKDNFSKVYKVFPVLPRFLKTLILERKLYRFFYLVPNCLVIIVQWISGVKARDYRFTIYINNYLRNFKNRLWGIYERKPK